MSANRTAFLLLPCSFLKRMVFGAQKSRAVFYCIICVLTVMFAVYAEEETFISADNPLIRYSGRFDMTNPEAPRFDWPGNMIELRFGGSSCAIKVRGDGGQYNIFINDSLFVTRFDTSETVYPLVRNMKDSVNFLRITKRFEGMKNRVVTVMGFYIDSGKTLIPIGEEPFYKIEFIGGSNLIGYGIESDNVKCKNHSVLSNSYKAFGAVAARELNADYHIIAIAGKGLVRNWSTPFLSASRQSTVVDFYSSTIKNDPDSKWDFNSWVPHVIVINFGNNDYSSYPHAPKELFIARYRNFLQEVKMRNPCAQIVCMATPREPFKTYLNEIVERERQEGYTQIHFYSFAQVPKHESGCDWHPGAAAQTKIGLELAELIRPLLKDYK